MVKITQKLFKFEVFHPMQILLKIVFAIAKQIQLFKISSQILQFSSNICQKYATIEIPFNFKG